MNSVSYIVIILRGTPKSISYEPLVSSKTKVAVESPRATQYHLLSMGMLHEGPENKMQPTLPPLH
ncbi:hypothetical protein LINPERHAP1_LOCUS38161 [Linum perenne]